jgi:glyoxylase-like metal-dependent hydrolase (beta-lactamase superfamily II)
VTRYFVLALLLACAPTIPQRTLSARSAIPLSKSLPEIADVKYVLLTHAHWDHTGGIAQVPQAAVLLSAPEAEWLKGHEEPYYRAAMPIHLKGALLTPFGFDGPPYEGFPSSHDIFGDGSIVASLLPDIRPAPPATS